VRDGAALLVHRSPDREVYPGVWDFPGGHVEPGESEPTALVRELAEELDVVVPAPVGEADLVLVGDGWRVAVWIVRAWHGEPRNAQPDEHDDLAWFDLDAALALDFADPEYRDLLRSALG
jgi:8-oxo-dGTP pyrophosphatase MutT (NUDIX family)